MFEMFDPPNTYKHTHVLVEETLFWFYDKATLFSMSAGAAPHIAAVETMAPLYLFTAALFNQIRMTRAGTMSQNPFTLSLGRNNFLSHANLIMVDWRDSGCVKGFT